MGAVLPSGLLRGRGSRSERRLGTARLCASLPLSGPERPQLKDACWRLRSGLLFTPAFDSQQLGAPALLRALPPQRDGGPRRDSALPSNVAGPGGAGSLQPGGKAGSLAPCASVALWSRRVVTTAAVTGCYGVLLGEGKVRCRAPARRLKGTVAMQMLFLYVSIAAGIHTYLGPGAGKQTAMPEHAAAPQPFPLRLPVLFRPPGLSAPGLSQVSALTGSEI